MKVKWGLNFHTWTKYTPIQCKTGSNSHNILFSQMEIFNSDFFKSFLKLFVSSKTWPFVATLLRIHKNCSNMCFEFSFTSTICLLKGNLRVRSFNKLTRAFFYLETIVPIVTLSMFCFKTGWSRKPSFCIELNFYKTNTFLWEKVK